MHAGQSKRAIDLVAFAATVIVRRFIADDARGHQACAAGDATRPLPHCTPGRQLRHHGAVAHHIARSDIVGARIDIDEAVADPPLQGRMIGIDAGIDHADAIPRTGEPQRLRGARIGQRQMRVECGFRCRRRCHHWRWRWRR